jgi:hypothetical protein
MVAMKLMRQFLAAVLAVFAFAMIDQASAQQPQQQQGEEPAFKQIKLSEQVIKNYIKAQSEMAALAGQQGAQPSDKPDPKVQAQLDAVAKKNGFATFADFDDVAFNVSMVMGGLDPQTGAFTDPISAIKKEIAEITADTSLPEKDKKQMLDELNEALKYTPPLQFPENVDLVKKHRAEIEKVLQ